MVGTSHSWEFALARVAKERGLDIHVVAPGSIPRAPGDRVKTDQRDTKRLVRLFAAGELGFAFVPSEADAHFRDLVRYIEDARKDLMRSRHRLSKFLLRRGQRFPCKAWTQPHEQWLGKLRFDDAPPQVTFVDYLCAVQTSRGCGTSVGSTRSPPPGCAQKSAISLGRDG
jgi:hypothetical protein